MTRQQGENVSVAECGEVICTGYSVVISESTNDLNGKNRL